MTAPSYDDLYNIGRAQVLIDRPDLFLAPGDVSDVIIAMAAAMADKVLEEGQESFRKTFIDGATGTDLTTLVDDHFSIQRSAETAATSNIDITRPSAGGGEPAGTLPAGFVFSTEEDATGERQEFTLNSPVSWTLGEVSTKSAVATATVAGRSGNVAAGAITRLVTGPFDSSITATNPTGAAGGNEPETDPQLRERARAFPSTLRRGTLDALEFGALTVPSVRVATAVEDTGGTVTVYVTDENGNSSAQMVADVASTLNAWRCAGTPLTVTGGNLFLQDITVDLTALKSGVTAASLAANIQAAVAERMRKLPVGDGTGPATNPGVLRLEILQAAVIGVEPSVILGVSITNPAADVVPVSGQIIRAGTVTVV